MSKKNPCTWVWNLLCPIPYVVWCYLPHLYVLFLFCLLFILVLSQAREDKEVVWDAGLRTGHYIGELFATIEGQMRGYARMRREEHMGWQSLLKQHRSFYAVHLFFNLPLLLLPL